MLVFRAPIVSLTAVPLRKSIGEILCIKFKGMATKTNLSKRLVKGSIDCVRETEKCIIEKETAESDVGIEDIKSDPNQLDSLTVKELRKITRSVGISSRGSKKELISALKDFSSENKTGIANPPSPVKTAIPESIPSKRVANSSVSTENQKRSKRKQEIVESDSVEDDSIAVVKLKQKKSSPKSEVIEKKNSKSSKKNSPSIQSSESAAGKIGLPAVSGEPWTVLVHNKPQKDWKPYTPNTMRPPHLSRDTNFVKLMSWNVNGLRALLKLESFSALQLAQKEDFDVLCLQETKIQEKYVEEIREHLIDGYDHSFWTCSVAKLGYSGTAIISRIKPISVKYGLGIPDHDSEGRLVTVEFDSFFLLCAYVPNSGDGLKRLSYRVEEWDQSLSNHMKELEKSKPVILTGDLNCAHQEIDIFNPAGNKRSAGFTIEERESFEKNFLSRGFVDTFRKQHPGVVAYTYWGYRHAGRKTNKGWRLDYFLASESIAGKVYDSYILPEVSGSDHCPIGLILKV